MTSRRFAVCADRLTRVFAGPNGPVVGLSEVSFALEFNRILAIIGANGAGKTTLIDILAGVVAPTSGHVQVERPFGYVPSGARSLYTRLTVLRNLEFFAALDGLCPVEARARSRAALQMSGASSVAEVRADRLSDGMSARVALARALLHDPAVLLLDEPARSIDAVHRPSLLRAIRDYTRQPGKAAVMVTHDLNDVFEICDHVGVMRQGRLVGLSAVVGDDSETNELRAHLDEHS